MYFFLFGMSFFYLPFFIMAHFIADPLGFPQDGFSLPYEWIMVFGGIIVTIFGLVYFAKILKHFFSDRIAAIVLTIIVFTTNWSHHCTIKNLETVNYLFTMASVTFWYTIRWHQTKRFNHLLGIGFGVVMAGLIKPSEVLILLFPFFYNVHSFQSFRSKLKLIHKHRLQFLGVMIFGFILCMPQLSYWLIKTGHILYDSYRNNGVGLDFLAPHTIDALFSFRKGWFIYTPVMIFAMIGFISLFKQNRQLFWPITIYFVVSLYIITSWTEWWYGAGFSNRPLISVYPFLAIPLGYLIQNIFERQLYLKIGFVFIIFLMSGLNLFQQWQQRNGILHPTRMTKEYYWKIFLTTEKKKEWEELLLVHRDLGGNEKFWSQNNYQVVANDPIVLHDTVTSKEHAFSIDRQFSSITDQDHLWIEMIIEYNCIKCDSKPAFYITNKMLFNNKTYGWKGFPMPIGTDTVLGDSTTTSTSNYIKTRLTPHLRRTSDEISTAVWNPAKNEILIKRFEVRYYERLPIELRASSS